MSPNPLKGIALMVSAMAILPLIDVIAKTLGQWGLPILIVVWARLAFGAALFWPLARKEGPFWPDRPLFHGLRAALLASATLTFFLSLNHLPIADALAIFFVQPLIVTALSGLVLREKVGLGRWVAVAVGFVGILVIIRPGFQALNPGSLLALAAGTFLAVYFVLTRSITGQTTAAVTTFHTNLMGALMLTLALPVVWQAPTAVEWAMLVALGVIATFGHFLIVRAYDHAEASLLAPFAYTEMIGAIAVGWIFFGDLPDRWTLGGVAILLAATLAITMQERAQARAAGAR